MLVQRWASCWGPMNETLIVTWWYDVIVTLLIAARKCHPGISRSNILSLGQRAKHRLMVPCGVMLSPCELAWPWEPVGTCYVWTRLFLWIPCAFFFVVNPIQRRGISLKIPRLDNCWPNKVNLIITKLILAWDLACKTG